MNLTKKGIALLFADTTCHERESRETLRQMFDEAPGTFHVANKHDSNPVRHEVIGLYARSTLTYFVVSHDGIVADLLCSLYDPA